MAVTKFIANKLAQGGHLALSARRVVHYTESESKPLPVHVFREVDAYLGCGILAHGFIRLHCQSCKSEKLVAFSCKKRGFCPSCGGRRMNEVSHHLVVT